MRLNTAKAKKLAAKLTAAMLCLVLLCGALRAPARAEAALADDPDRLVDLYCSQSAKDGLSREQLQALVSLIVTSIEPQAVNLLVERFPCFKEAAEHDALGREIGLYIYFGTGDQDGIAEHEDVAPGAYAYVSGYPDVDDNETVFKYMICIDAESLCTPDDMDDPVLDLDGQSRIQVDTTFCHELFHAFMDDYNRVGMSGFFDFTAFTQYPEDQLTQEEGDKLFYGTAFPGWFVEGLAGCVGNIYPADLDYFYEYHYDIDAGRYLEACTPEQLCRMYVHWDRLNEHGGQKYDMEASWEDNDDGHVNGAMYVSGYMACLYLADLGCRQLEGEGAMTFDENGGVASISSEKLRAGLSLILSRLHQGETLDEVIRDVSGGYFTDTQDFTRRFIKGAFNEEVQDYDGDPETLDFCVGYLNYMERLDALDPETHPVGSMLMDDFGSTQPTPIEKDVPAASDFYRFVEKNTLVNSTVPDESVRDGGTSYSGQDSFEAVLEEIREAEGA